MAPYEGMKVIVENLVIGIKEYCITKMGEIVVEVVVMVEEAVEVAAGGRKEIP